MTLVLCVALETVTPMAALASSWILEAGSVALHSRAADCGIARLTCWEFPGEQKGSVHRK